jgi:hypothetical protein
VIGSDFRELVCSTDIFSRAWNRQREGDVLSGDCSENACETATSARYHK